MQGLTKASVRAAAYITAGYLLTAILDAASLKITCYLALVVL